MISTGAGLDYRAESQERLTRMGQGTPMGTYMRCFWHPIAAVVELKDWPIKKVRLLGEDLALYRGDDGTLGLVADRCAHRGASLSCGMIDGPHLRCAYHGWAYDTTGQCVDTPAEPAESKLKDRIRLAGYPVQELGGLVWAYLGRLPAPLLPRYEFMVHEAYDHEVGYGHIPCNWLQIVENNMDPYHVELLHGRYAKWVRTRMGLEPPAVYVTKKVKYEPFEYGFVKKRLWEGASEDSQEWTTGHPMLFPGNNIVRIGEGWIQLELRIPVDDTNTTYYWYDCKVREPGKAPATEVPLWENRWKGPNGEFRPEVLTAQDMMVMVSQGPITNHSLENYGESDRGVAMYRRALLEQIEVSMRGEDPLGVLRDPAKNTPWLELPMEREPSFSQVLVGSAFMDNAR